jgi:hypothetical protein
MPWKYVAAGLLLFCQGCADDRITWSFPPMHMTNEDERIVGYKVIICDDAVLVDIENMASDWDLSFDTGLWRSFLTIDPCLPEIRGGCLQGATGFSNSKDLPRFVFKSNAKTNHLKVIGTISVITNWYTWETRDIALSDMAKDAK